MTYAAEKVIIYINLADVLYDTLESELDDSELITKQKMIEALKQNGIDDSQIEKIIDSINN